MCTVLFAKNVFESYPVVIAANRDESYDREFSSPETRETEDEGDSVDWIFAPRDEREGGTWIGFNSEGTSVAVTNIETEDGDSQDSNTDDETEVRSRGLLCDDVLSESGDIEDLEDVVRHSVDENEYEGFNLVVGTTSRAFVAVYDGDLDFVYPEDGIHVVTNSRFDDPDDKAVRVSDSLPEPSLGLDDWVDEAECLLSRDDIDVCLHSHEDDDKGTTSSSIIGVRNPDVSESFYLFADGAPCEADYEKFTPPGSPGSGSGSGRSS
ncbi:MAG: NRDE family protein [Halobacteria archaeon]|nr:NRDE family protein [Halobacteria archaeon]